MVLYVAAFSLLFLFLLVVPDLVATFREVVARQGEVRPEDQERFAQVARHSLAGRVHWALGAAVLVTGLGIWTERLPGLRRP